LQRFLKGSRAFGPQRRASERLATDIALENLARSAGAVDARRLTWAMEAREVADLAAGPLEAIEDEVAVSLRIDPEGAPRLEVRKRGRTLKRIPPKLRKLPEIAALVERSKALTDQGARMRLGLEEAMVRGDGFAPDELEELQRHPLLRPLLSTLVLVSEGGALGTPAGGRTLLGADGSEATLGTTSVRIAHPTDLLAAGADVWARWQRIAFERGRAQPFKQLFRELYPLTGAEREGGRGSRRYEGHQVNPRQALALLGKRGWVSVPDEGSRRTFHHDGVSAHLTFLEGFTTPADVDGLTLAEVFFTRRGEGEPLDLEAVPARLFSEAMRDLDLAVSVAHRGGVDPEASASTVEMRRALLRETAELLGLGNVRLEGRHALIDGALGRYSIHLGSAQAHRQPGGALFIVPVHSQQRGRLFLPFADDDPKTAELLSKVILLAQDDQIRDPTILEQLS
jgi:predicted RNA binding protein YcfA (HicA-like mRNA interferase family)